jgi:hypothetical protein
MKSEFLARRSRVAQSDGEHSRILQVMLTAYGEADAELLAIVFRQALVASLINELLDWFASRRSAAGLELASIAPANCCARHRPFRAAGRTPPRCCP